MDLEEALETVRERLRSKSLRKAVGGRVAEAIQVLAERCQCGCISEREAAELINNYYIFEARLRRLLELYDKLSRGSLAALAREVLGEDFYLEPVSYDLLLKELEAYRRHLFAVAERALRCQSSTSSKA